MNSNDAQLYTNNSYQLGHWIGSNGYQVYSSYRQSITRGFYFKLSGNYIVKGQKELPVQQYQTPYPQFLYGPHKGYKDVRMEVSYEVIHTGFVKGYYEYTDIYDDEAGRTPEFMKGGKGGFGVGVRYGL